MGDVAIRGTLQEAYLASNDDLTDCIPVGLAAVPENDFQELGLPYCPFSYSSHMDNNYLRNALTVFYNATGGPQGEWSNSENWLTDKPLGEWYGITTADELGENTTELVGLDLRNNGLTGQLPGMLGYLRHLETLNLSGNQLTGPIPANYGDLNTLINLNLGGNRLSGLLPAELSNNYVLGRLHLYDNELEGAIPEQMGSLYGLRTLSLRDNQLTGELPQGMSRLTNLTWLNLEHNLLTGEIPAWLGGLEGLAGLGLGHNRLRGQIPAELGNLTNLRELYLDNQDHFRGNPPPNAFEQDRQYRDLTNWLHGSLPEELGRIENLRVLDLSGNRLNGTIPATLGDLLELKILDLGGNALNGEIPAMAVSQSLNELDLYDNDNFSGCIPLSRPKAKRLDVHPGLRGLPDTLCPTPQEIAADLADAESRALADLYLATDGFNWTENDNWFDGSDHPHGNNWHGVHTDDEGRVIGLDLRNNNLAGWVPPDLSNLTHLQWLKLGDNTLCIPGDLGGKVQYGPNLGQYRRGCGSGLG